MELANLWLLVLWVVVIAMGLGVVTLLRTRRRKRAKAEGRRLIANTGWLRALPEYRSAMRQFRVLVVAGLVCIACGVGGAAVLTARPIHIDAMSSREQNRDIMLCLDVSGSVLPLDARLVARFQQLVKDFSGQRFGFVIFNTTPLVKIPLTDDYALIQSELESAQQAVGTGQPTDAYSAYTAGTTANGDVRGGSVIGDGLASCINHLGPADSDRSRSVVLATDGEIEGQPIVPFAQAIHLAKDRGIRVYALDPGMSGGAGPADTPEHLQQEHDDLRQGAVATGGLYYLVSNAGSVADIIANIGTQEAKTLNGPPQLVVADVPDVILLVLALLLGAGLLLLWKADL